MLEHAKVGQYLDELKTRQVPWVPYPTVLTFLGTSGSPGHSPSVALGEVVSLSPGNAPTDMNVRMRGQLPRPLLLGDSITLSISRYQKFHGYQIKTAPLRSRDAQSEAFEKSPQGDLLVHGRQAYTTHHGPYELNFFERIPFDEVQSTVGTENHAVIAVGPQANVSPRLVWHHELSHGRLVTYHGDGVAMKTFRNLCANKSSVRLVFDFESLTGFALHGPCEEIPPEAAPGAFRHTCNGFEALGFGKPSRFFRHVCERIEPVALPRA
jgi:hypothetical protein